VSGFVGSTCQFKNLSEYLLFNINEVSRIKAEKDQLKKDTKELKGKTETLTKNMIALNDKSVQLCNKYTDNKQAEFEKALDNTSKDLNEKNMEMRSLMLKYKEAQEENEKKHLEEFNKLVNMKEEFINLINNKFSDIKTIIDELDYKIANSNGNIEINKNKIEAINGQIKELYKSDKDILFQIRNYYFANTKFTNLMDKFGTGSSNANITKLTKEMNSNQRNYTGSGALSELRDLIAEYKNLESNFNEGGEEEEEEEDDKEKGKEKK
jgi:chromosome segregation ATPase